LIEGVTEPVLEYAEQPDRANDPCDPSDRLWLRASIILLPLVVMFCLMRGSEARVAR
jgi:hypothetical protein